MSHDITIAVVVGAGRIQELVVPHLRIKHTRTRQVSENHTKGYREQKQGLILLLDSKVKQEAADKDHYGTLPTLAYEE